MPGTITMLLTGAAAIGCGLMAGLFFAFSVFIMKALGAIPANEGVAAMQSINATIVKTSFIPAFMGTALLGAALAVLAVVRGGPGASMLIAGGLLYILGTLAVTMIFNVPLNNKLAAVARASPEAAEVWAAYLNDWTLWNHVRTAAATAACAAYIMAIAAIARA